MPSSKNSGGASDQATPLDPLERTPPNFAQGMSNDERAMGPVVHQVLVANPSGRAAALEGDVQALADARPWSSNSARYAARVASSSGRPARCR